MSVHHHRCSRHAFEVAGIREPWELISVVITLNNLDLTPYWIPDLDFKGSKECLNNCKFNQ
jgi:hypothetical protein